MFIAIRQYNGDSTAILRHSVTIGKWNCRLYFLTIYFFFISHIITFEGCYLHRIVLKLEEFVYLKIKDIIKNLIHDIAYT